MPQPFKGGTLCRRLQPRHAKIATPVIILAIITTIISSWTALSHPKSWEGKEMSACLSFLASSVWSEGLKGGCLKNKNPTPPFAWHPGDSLTPTLHGNAVPHCDLSGFVTQWQHLVTSLPGTSLILVTALGRQELVSASRWRTPSSSNAHFFLKRRFVRNTWHPATKLLHYELYFQGGWYTNEKGKI